MLLGVVKGTFYVVKMPLIERRPLQCKSAKRLLKVFLFTNPLISMSAKSVLLVFFVLLLIIDWFLQSCFSHWSSFVFGFGRVFVWTAVRLLSLSAVMRGEMMSLRSDSRDYQPFVGWWRHYPTYLLTVSPDASFHFWISNPLMVSPFIGEVAHEKRRGMEGFKRLSR